MIIIAVRFYCLVSRILLPQYLCLNQSFHAPCPPPTPLHSTSPVSPVLQQRVCPLFHPPRPPPIPLHSTSPVFPILHHGLYPNQRYHALHALPTIVSPTSPVTPVQQVWPSNCKMTFTTCPWKNLSVSVSTCVTRTASSS